MKNKIRNIFSNIYIFTVAFSIVPMLYLSAQHINTSNILFIMFWVALEVAADLRPFRVIYYQQIEITMSFAVQLSVIIVLGTYQAVWVVITATIITEVVSKKPWNRVLFNAGQYGLSIYITGLIFHSLKLSAPNTTLDIIFDLPATLVSVSIFFLLNTFFISIVISLTAGSRFKDVFFSDFRIIAGYFFSLTPISIASSLLYQQSRPYIVLIMIPPLIMADQSVRRYYSLNHETQESLKVLANIVDERDSYTFSHSVNVSKYAKQIAVKMRLSMDEVNAIEIAGQVHDLGKVGIEGDILFKKSSLNKEEYDRIKQHPEIAYRLLKNLKPYKKAAEYVLSHHERIDGKGYPEGKSGDKLPLGARILAVADSFDAMTTDRPYRTALSRDIAAEELVKCSGTQFDREVVKAFIEVLAEKQE